MGRPPVIPAEQKTRIVLSVLAGEMTIAEAARREKVSEQSIGRWKADFLEAGKTALAAGRSGPSTREQQLEAEVADLTQALGEYVPVFIALSAASPFVDGVDTLFQSARLNGKEYDKNYFTHQDIVQGGTLEFQMGPNPNPNWGASTLSLPPETMK